MSPRAVNAAVPETMQGMEFICFTNNFHSIHKPNITVSFYGLKQEFK
jgi:hypothetical protein